MQLNRRIDALIIVTSLQIYTTSESFESSLRSRL